MGKGGGFHGTAVAALPTPALAIRARVVVITLDAMDTAPVAGSANLASFLPSGPREWRRAGRGLRNVRRRGGTGRRHADESGKHGLESGDEEMRR